MGVAVAAAAAYLFALLYLLSHHILLLHSAPPPPPPPEEEKYCPPFHCGKDYDNPGSGWLKVDTCSKPVEKIQVKVKEHPYDVVSIAPANTIDFNDQSLIKHLQYGCGCKEEPSLNFTSTASISFETKSNLNCTGTGPHTFFSYISNLACSAYYKENPPPPPLSSSSSPSSSSAPQCSPIPPPINITNITNYQFSLLAAQIFLVVGVFPDCRKCYYKGSECRNDINGKFQCSSTTDSDKGKNKRRALKLGLGIVCSSAFLITVCLLIFFILRRRHKQKHGSSDFLMRNTSADPNSKSELDRGGVYFGVPIFPYSELEEATNNFDPTKELGDGGFGTVYHGKLRDGREVAVKRLYENSYKRVEQFMNEIEILTRLRHKNLVSLYGCTSRHSRELLLVYEFIPNGTVADHLHGDLAKPGSPTWPIRMSIAIETAEALTYLHATDIIHRDVKTNNILLDNNFCVKVADFGLSRLFPVDVTHVSTAPQGTPGYVDPEYHQCYQLTDKSDVYSFGVVLIELISSLPAVDISRHRHEINLANLAINKIQNSAFNELVDPYLGFESNVVVRRMMTSVAELAFRCLQHDKELRPYMDEVLEVLKGIESEGYEVEKTEEVDGDDVGVLQSTSRSPFSLDSNDDGLSKNMQLPHSLNCVTEKRVRWSPRLSASV